MLLLATVPTWKREKNCLKPLSVIKQPSTSKDTIISTLKSAREAINQAPGLYRGHRVKAIEFIDEAITQANNGSEQNKTYSYIRKAIVEVNAGIQLAR